VRRSSASLPSWEQRRAAAQPPDRDLGASPAESGDPLQVRRQPAPFGRPGTAVTGRLRDHHGQASRHCESAGRQALRGLHEARRQEKARRPGPCHFRAQGRSYRHRRDLAGGAERTMRRSPAAPAATPGPAARFGSPRRGGGRATALRSSAERAGWPGRSRGADLRPVRPGNQSVSKWRVSTEVRLRSSDVKLPEAPS
jgi:hypothetical protein